jgi:hypothetical protein
MRVEFVHDSRTTAARRRRAACLVLALALVAPGLAASARQLDIGLEPATLKPTARASAVVAAPRAARLDDARAPRRCVVAVLLGPDEDVAEVHGPWPVRHLGTSAYHGYRIAHVAILDAGERPAAGSLRIVTRPAAAPASRLQRPDALRTLAIRRQVQELVVNPDGLGGYAQPEGVSKAGEPVAFAATLVPSLEGSPVEMLILTREALAAAFQEYADFKTGLGTPTVVRSIESIVAEWPRGADLQETLRSYIRQAYELWGIRFVLLGGDTDLVPARYATSLYSLEGNTVPTDLYYACLDGDWNADGDAAWGEGYVYSTDSSDQADLYPEVYVSRLPVTTPAEVQAYLRKLEFYVEPVVTDYQGKLLFMAEVIWPATYKPGDPILKNGADNVERLIDFSGLERPELTLKKLYETPAGYSGASPLTLSDAIANMNSGHALVTDIGHGFRYTMSLGNASLTNMQALFLNNDQRPFFLNMLNCSAAAFDFPCLAEKFVLNSTGGAVGVIGASREAYPDNIQLYQEGWFQKLFAEGFTGAAEALHETRLRYLSLTFDDGAYRWSNFITNYFGDPQVEVWMGAPRTAVVTHTGTLALGALTYSVQVASGGAPVADATVCMWKEGALYSVGRTNASGIATLKLRAEAPGPAQLSVSGSGLRPYRGTVTVQNMPGPALRCTDQLTVQDSGAGTTGNGNGVLEAGETAFVRFEVRNEGGTTAGGVSLLATCSDPNLVVTGGSVSVSDLPPGAAALSQPVTLRIASNAVDLHRVRLDLLLRTIEGWTWGDRIDFDLLQAAPQVVRVQVQDATSGNANGVPDAGETYQLLVELKNYGFARLDGASAQLLSLDPDATVLDGSASLGGVDHLASAGVDFLVRETAVAQPNHMLLIVFDVRGRSWTFDLETRRPLPPSTLVGDPSGGQGVATLGWSPSPSADVLGYHVYRATHSGGPWTRASADLIASATYFRDDGLASGARYYYYVVAVDSSRNESPRTTPLALTTNPGVLAGWPRALGMWSNSSAAVAQLDGDGPLEIVTGASDRLYAWNADGHEVRDGDGNAATNGVFSALGQNYAAGPAVGDLDHDGLDEIVACSWDTRQVFVFQGDGSVRPGWPRSIVTTTHGIWATPALGDLDLDGNLDIVVLGLDGRLYAWRADGSELRDGDADPTTQGVLWVNPSPATWSRGAPAIANILTADAAPEIVFGTENSRIYMLRADGSVAPGWPKVCGSRVSSSPSIGDIDGDGGLEIAVPSQDGKLYVLRGDGTALAGWPRTLPNDWPGTLLPSVALADLDGDGKLELVAGSTGGNVESGSLYVFDWQGSVRPGWPVDVHSAAEASPIVGDLNSDGQPEIVYGGESGILYGFELDGSLAPGFPIRVGAEVRSTPTLADVDGDTKVDLILSCWDQQVYVWSFSGLYVRHTTPWGAFKGNMLRNGIHGYREPTDTPEVPAAPARTGLLANVPNPFNPTTAIRFDIGAGAPQRVRLRIFDVRGRVVRTLVDRPLAPGRYVETWDGRDEQGRASSSGVYFSRLETPATTTSRKMVLVR